MSLIKIRLELQAETGYKKAELWMIDLSEFASVKAFATHFEQDGGRLDILVMNAGISLRRGYESSVEGWEST
jgi:NAD(P)-dependent dehydrogenase (short-subunit alcohol dehydrogenase family)